MPFTGGFAPSPVATGGGDGGSTASVSQYQRTFEALASARGSLYSQSIASYIGVENSAYARALVLDGYAQNYRLANQNFPYTLTEAGLLSAWETIFGVVPLSTDTLIVRQTRIAYKWQLIGSGNGAAAIATICTNLLGSRYQGLQILNPNNATTYWPGGTTSSVTPWYSGISNIDIIVAFSSSVPSAQQVADLQNSVAPVTQLLIELLPAHVTFAYAVAPSGWTSGLLYFKLDDTHNLDFEVFGAT